jgi:predicted O-methyltransferase YrrM
MAKTVWRQVLDKPYGAEGVRGPKRYLRQAYFGAVLLFDRLGLHVLRKTYYSPVPDWTWLMRHKEAWMARSSLPGVRWDLDQQLAWVADICQPYYHEVAGLSIHRQALADGFGLFAPIESQVLHCFVRAKAPSRVLEIGSGLSTVCMLHAAELNRRDGKPFPEIVCIDPHPRKAFRKIEKVTLIEQPCQLVPNEVFDQLQPGDLLFIDSTHAVKVGSEVIRLYLDIIPRLKAGVIIHIHDIFLPYLYPRSTLSHPDCCQETALLLALLINNPRLTILASLSALHYDRPDGLESILSDYKPQANMEGLPLRYSSPGQFPNSLWLRTC